ncbi:MAG: hypothetical protein U0175_38110 [Caldilineaceae bacterium]
MNSETEQLLHFLQAVYSPKDDALCAQIRSRLYDYVVAFVNWNQDRTTFDLSAFADLRQHLDGCVACSEAFSRLYTAVVQPMSSESLGSIPEPDLSFLRPKESLSEQLRRALSRVGETIRLQLSGDLLPALRPALAIGALRSSQGQEYGELLLQLDPPAELADRLPTAISVYRAGSSPVRCLVEVTVTLPDRAWPDLAGIPVTLSIGQQVRTQQTDAFGVASFEGIAIEELPAVAIEVKV